MKNGRVGYSLLIFLVQKLTTTTPVSFAERLVYPRWARLESKARDYDKVASSTSTHNCLCILSDVDLKTAL
jgi:hypothetical protein